MKWLPIEQAVNFMHMELDIWAGDRYCNCAHGRETYGKRVGWIYQSGYDSDGPVFDLVLNPTHFMFPPAPPED